MNTVFFVVPILSVKVFTVNKNGKFVSLESKVWLAKNSLVVFTVAVSKPPKSFCQKDFILCRLAPDGFHIFPSLFFGQNVHSAKLAKWLRCFGKIAALLQAQVCVLAFVRLANVPQCAVGC
ncbi:MAG: hypothetical protein M9898_13910 [Chitinophagaceae bacterium]|nr:hypothetical protein [Chitinophagaceae bacterium]